MNIPNLLSLIRIIEIPFFVYYFLKDNLPVAAIILVTSGLSDLLDGYIARKYNQITELGKILDPIADKLTLGAVVICMWILYAKEIPMMNVCFTIMIAKELLMGIGSLFLVKKGTKPTAAKWYGKVSTVFFYFTMIILVALEAFYIDFAGKSALITILVCITALLAIGAFLGYANVALNLAREANNAKDKKDLQN